MKRAVTLASLWALLLGGCGFFAEGPANRCASDAECADGTCNVDLGMCESSPREPMLVGIEVVPATDPFGGTVVRVSFDAFELSGPLDDHPLALPAGVPTRGLVRDATRGPITANVSFHLRSAFEGGQSFVTTAQSAAELTEEPGAEPSNFSTQLLPNRIYDITISPNGIWAARLPPWRLPSSLQTPEGGARRVPLLAYPHECSVGELREPSPTLNCLVLIEGTVVDTQREAQDGMIVRVVPAAGGGALSSTYETGSDEGRDAGYFRVLMHISDWLATGEWLFSVTPSSERVAALGPSPSFSVDPNGLLADDSGRYSILTPDVATVVTYSGLVESLSPSAPLANANVSFRAVDVVDSETGVVGAFTTTASTGYEGETLGRFEVQLLPGTYEVVVTPGAGDLGLRVHRQQITIGMASGTELRGQVFQLPARSAFGGTVNTSSGEAIIDALVRASPRGALSGTLAPVSMFARPNDTRTDLDGRFAMGLDVGVFDIVVEPPLRSNYPWLIRSPQEIGGSDAPFTGDFQLDAPVPVSGVAFHEEGVPVVEGEVRAFAIVEQGGVTRTIQIGRTVTDADGHYRLLLPPSL